MRDEKMQETMYQYLPENMRNKETFDWMLSNPEFRGQLQTMLEKQASMCHPVKSCCHQTYLHPLGRMLIAILQPTARSTQTA